MTQQQSGELAAGILRLIAGIYAAASTIVAAGLLIKYGGSDTVHLFDPPNPLQQIIFVIGFIIAFQGIAVSASLFVVASISDNMRIIATHLVPDSAKAEPETNESGPSL